MVGSLLSRGLAAMPAAPQESAIPFNALFEGYSRRYIVPKRLMVAIVAHESGFNPGAVNKELEADRRKGRDVESIGLCQILFPDTAQAYRPGIGRQELLDPVLNLAIGFEVMRDNLARWPALEGGFPAQAVAAYNAGAPRHNPDGTFRNQRYVDAVRRHWEGYADA